MKAARTAKFPKVLVIDVGGTNVKMLTTGQKEPRKYPSGPTMTPRKMVRLVNRATGTVTLFAFDEGQGLNEHTAPFDAVAHLLEGEAEIAISGKPLRTTAGEAILTPAGQPHSLKALSRFKMLLTMIRS
jgi:quercetin dioxygenase-like cupin family protein